MPKPVAGINIQKDVDNSTKIWYYITVCTEKFSGRFFTTPSTIEFKRSCALITTNADIISLV